jgi:hypothetical protein
VYSSTFISQPESEAAESARSIQQQAATISRVNSHPEESGPASEKQPGQPEAAGRQQQLSANQPAASQS